MPLVVAGRSIEEWEGLFKSEIEEHLKQERLDSLVYEIDETEKVGNYVIKKRGEDRVVRDESGTTTMLAPIVTEPATPTKIDLRAPIKVWIDDPKVRLDHLFMDLAREVAERETRTVLKSLLSVGKAFKVQDGLVTTDMLREPRDWLVEHDQYPDTLVVHPSREARLLIESRELLNAWQLPERFRVSEGPHFVGLLGGTNVYWTPFIDEYTLLLYQKAEVRERRTGLDVRFLPDRNNPDTLAVREECLAWAVDDNSVTVVHLVRPETHG